MEPIPPSTSTSLSTVAESASELANPINLGSDIAEKNHTLPPPACRGGDDALNIVSDTIRRVTPEEDKQILRKVDRHIMPVLFTIYFLQFMDKQILSLSSVFGIVRDTHLKGEEYSLVGSVAPIAQMALQPLSAYFLVRFRLSIYIPILVMCWGLTLACMSVAHDFPGLLVSRFFLGGFETSTQAAFILIGQMWYKRQEQGLRLTIWFSNVGWVNIIGSLIMYGFGHITNGALRSYQVAFVVLGAVTFLAGIASFFVFPDNPVRSKFLTPDEKIIAVERIRANQQGVETKIFKFTHVFETLLDLKSWCWMGLLLLQSIPGGAINIFGPLIVRGFGYDGYEVMLFLIPYGTLQVIFMGLSYWISTKSQMKSPLVIIFLVPCIIGMIILYTTGRSREHQPALLAAYYLLSSSSAVLPVMLGWQAVNTAGHTKKASTTALTIMGSYSGAIIGPLLFEPQDGPYYHSGIRACIICYSGAVVLALGTTAYLHYLNKKNEVRRVRAGKAAKITDYSMVVSNTKTPAPQSSGAKEKEEGLPQDSVIGQRAFEDLTDLENDEFIYVL